MTKTPEESTPSSVPAGARPDGEVRARWAWTEPAVWTERMLTALETGVKGGTWFSLIDKVYAPANLAAAWQRVAGNKGAAGIDGQTVADFATVAPASLAWLAEALRAGRYVPSAVRRVWVPKPGSPQDRPLGIPTVRDRVVQRALCNVLEPIFERRFVATSYGFRPGRACHDALRRVDELLHRGFTHVVDADIQDYFGTIDPDLLLADVQKDVADGRVLALLRAFLDQSVMEGLRAWTPERGVPQGSVLGPVLANLYLHPVDVALRDAGFEGVRYADDLVILCESEVRAAEALAFLTVEMTGRRLTLHPTKTRLVDATAPGGFDFLGYHFEQGRKTPRAKSLMKFKAGVRALTPRLCGRSFASVITRLNQTLRGWFGYFKHSAAWVFTWLDGWTRGRLRVILSRRHHHKGIRRGLAHRRWPNAFFVQQGLFSMATAHALARGQCPTGPTNRRAGCGRSARPVRREGGPG